MQTRILTLFTRTPLHVGAGASVGAIDQPIQRERHTGFPVIPASALKGSFADHWNDSLQEELPEPAQDRKPKWVRVTKDGKPTTAAWLFGSDSDQHAFAGALLFSEARLLAFPIRSAKGSYAWITCPIMLQRAARDGVFGDSAGTPGSHALLAALAKIGEPADDEAIYAGDRLDLSGKIVLEEYCFKQARSNDKPQCLPDGLAAALSALVPDDLWQNGLADRLVILSNGNLSHFVTTACEVAQHVRISDETGTAEEGGLFNQENVPGETLFYSVLHATKGRGGSCKDKAPAEALAEFAKKLQDVGHVFQFGGDASTGLGFCTVNLTDKKEA